MRRTRCLVVLAWAASVGACSEDDKPAGVEPIVFDAGFGAPDAAPSDAESFGDAALEEDAASQLDASPIPDSGVHPDANEPPDEGLVFADAEPIDQGLPDTGPPDTGPPDLGPADTGPVDTGPPDLGPTDTGVLDAQTDAGAVDAGPDGGSPDASTVCEGFGFEPCSECVEQLCCAELVECYNEPGCNAIEFNTCFVDCTVSNAPSACLGCFTSQTGMNLGACIDTGGACAASCP